MINLRIAGYPKDIPLEHYQTYFEIREENEPTSKLLFNKVGNIDDKNLLLMSTNLVVPTNKVYYARFKRVFKNNEDANQKWSDFKPIYSDDTIIDFYSAGTVIPEVPMIDVDTETDDNNVIITLSPVKFSSGFAVHEMSHYLVTKDGLNIFNNLYDDINKNSLLIPKDRFGKGTYKISAAHVCEKDIESPFNHKKFSVS